MAFDREQDDPLGENLRQAFAREVEKLQKDRASKACPTLDQWWANTSKDEDFTEEQQVHIATCEHCQGMEKRFNRVRPATKIIKMIRRLKAIAAALILALLVALGGTGLYAYQTHSALSDALARLKNALAGSPIQPATVDSSRREFARGREFSRRDSDLAGELVLQLSPFLGPPYYTGLEVIWDAEASPEPRPELIYRHGYKALQPLIRHTYQLPEPGSQRRTTALLIYRLSGEGMAKFQCDQVVIEKLPLILTSSGIRVSSDRASGAISASVSKPARDDTLIPEEFTLELTLRAPARLQADDTPDSDRMIHVLVRPLNGPLDGQKVYSVLPFTQRVSDLPKDGSEALFDTWAALPGIIRSYASAEGGDPTKTGPTQFEILVIELPLRLVQQEVSKDKMDLDDPTLFNEVVRARRVVQYMGPQG